MIDISGPFEKFDILVLGRLPCDGLVYAVVGKMNNESSFDNTSARARMQCNGVT